MFAQVHVVGVVVFRAAEIPLQPGAAPELAPAVDAAALATVGIGRDRGADHVRRQLVDRRGHQPPAGHRQHGPRRAGLHARVEPVENPPPCLVRRLVLADAFRLEAEQVVQVGVIVGDLVDPGRDKLRIVDGRLVVGHHEVEVHAQPDPHAARVGVGDDLLEQARPLAEDLDVGERLVVQAQSAP